MLSFLSGGVWLSAAQTQNTLNRKSVANLGMCARGSAWCPPNTPCPLSIISGFIIRIENAYNKGPWGVILCFARPLNIMCSLPSSPTLTWFLCLSGSLCMLSGFCTGDFDGELDFLQHLPVFCVARVLCPCVIRTPRTCQERFVFSYACRQLLLSQADHEMLLPLV